MDLTQESPELEAEGQASPGKDARAEDRPLERRRVDLGVSDLSFETEGPIAWLTFNRPQAHNAMTWPMFEGLVQACQWVDRSPDTKVLILRGAGERAFISGADISQFQEFKAAGDILAYDARMNSIISSLEGVNKVTIALIRGYAVGGGAVIALACDLRLWAPDGQLGMPIAKTLGNCLSIANYVRLVELLGLARAKELIFTARMIGAEEAQRIGLANEVVPADQLEARARELALTIASHAPLTLQASKEAMRRILAQRTPAEAEDLILKCYLSEDFREGVRSFLERRPPRWRGF